MADFQPSETSTAVAPIKVSSSGESGKEVEDGRSGDGDSASAPHGVLDISTVDGGNANIRRVATDLLDARSSVQEHSKELQTTAEAVTTTAQAHPQHPVPPLKRFTSVNINKRFLETTSSSSGISSGGNLLAGHSSNSVGAQGQRRGASPAAARSPSTDRPAPSRLVTAKLTAVPQPSAASTAGWLRTNPSAPGSATSTPPSSSPQPTNGAPTSHSTQSASSTGVQQSKLRPGELPSQNGVVASSTSSSTAQQSSSKPVWGKVPPPPSSVRGQNTDVQINDFPTAAEAAHGRKTKALNAQLAAENAAAQTAAQKQAMNETAAAFRGVHLDPNTHHWDEMEDEDSDFLAGVIEFGDGTQYKIEHKTESTPPQQNQSAAPTPDAAKLQSSESPLISQPHVSKEERFGEDFDRSWPRARTSPVRPTATSSHPPRIAMPHQGGSPHSPMDSPASTSTSVFSPHDGTSPTSRVLFNERSNRLEPWSSAKPRSGFGQASGSTPRRDSREEHSQFGLFRQHGRDAPPHSHSSSSNVQLLQKSGADSAWKGGPPRNFSHAPERGRWGAPSQRDEDRPWETRRRESMSSSDAAGTSAREMSRDRELGRSRRDIGSDRQQRNWERRPSNSGMPPPSMPPQSVARDESRDAGRQPPPHLSRMPPPHVPPIRSAEVAPDANTVSQDPVKSPSVSVRSMLSPTSEKGPSATGIEEGVDKDSLVKSAMQLAIERAKKRKQEGEEEEKRRLEAAERARKKAETLAAAQGDMKKAQTLPPPQESKVTEQLPARDAPQSLPRMNGTDTSNKSRDNVDAGAPRISQMEHPLSKGIFSRPQPRVVNPVPVLPRKSSISVPVEITPASQADSWRSKAAPVPSSPPPPRPSSPPPQRSSRGGLPPTTQDLELDLTLPPDENIEVVDFCDLGRFMGRSPSHTSPAARDPAPAHSPTTASLSIRARRPVASDFFDDRPSSSVEHISPVNSDIPSWRRSALKPVIGSPPDPTGAGDVLKTQTMPIFSTDDPAPVKEAHSSAEGKPVSTSSSSPPFNRQSFQNDHGLSTATQSSPAAVASRSPRTASYFKEAPMSTLTDTMSRIKGALDGMQSQDPPPVFQPRESKEKDFFDQRSHDFTQPMKTRNTEVSPISWRERREPRSEVMPQVTKILTPPARSLPREVFDITHPDPPLSPKPAWNAFIVRLPKESRFRDAISRKQLHFWNLPHPGVRWDILSWEPPVEGMNKRELSRDEIFHRKYAIRGGKLRVSLPNKRIAHPMSDARLGLSDASSLPVLVTSAGVKIKLPSNASSYKDKTVVTSRTVFSARPRESSVPSWRKSAMPLAQLKHDYRNAKSRNGSSSDHELNTTSRSPPPEPSTPLPQFSPLRDSAISSSGPTSATVSLPTNSPSHSKVSGLKRPSGTNVAFFRSSRGEASAGINGPLPRFTVTSELDRSGELGNSPKTDHAVSGTKNAAESTQAIIKSLKGSPQIVPTEIPQGVVSSISDDKGSEEFASGTRPVTPPSTHNSSAWGKSPLSFSMKESPARSAPDPEHLKAVWSQPSGRTTATTSNSLKGIADDLPSIPFTVQDMKSEDGETPPPTAPAPQPSRLSLQEVTRAFQQVPGAPVPVTSPSSRPPSYAATPLLSSNTQQSFRTPQMGGMSLPPHGIRPIFAPYPQSSIGHSPSPTFMYAPGIASPMGHHRMPLNNASPPIAHPMWLPTPPPQSNQAAAFMRAGPQAPAPMIYPSPIPGASSGAPGQMVHRRMSVVSPPGPATNVYQGHPMEMQGHIHQTHAHVQSPHHTHAHPVTHPVHIHQIFSPPPHGQAPAMYAVPVGAGRGGIMPRPAYESMQQVPHLTPHNPSYQPVPPTSFSHPFHS